MVPAAAWESLAQRAVMGDRSALTALLEQHGPLVRARFQSQIPKRWQSMISLDDLMQETYTDAFLGVAEFAAQDESSFERWLITIAKHNLSNAIRMLEAEKRGGGRTRVELAGPEDSVDALYEFVRGSGSTPSGAAARVEARTTLLRAVDQLPEDYRRVVQIYDLEGRPVDDVCRSMNRRPGAVFMLRARAHRALAKLMGSSSNFLSGSS